MARVKPEILWIKDLEHANQTLGEMAGIERSLAEIDRVMNATIDQAKSKAAALAAPLKARLEEADKGLAVFATGNKQILFVDKKTQDCLFGSFGFRKSVALGVVVKTTWAMVLGNLKRLAFKDAIKIKEEIDKDAMREWPEERLALVGVKRIEKDVFWRELKKEEAVA